jgi:ubiquinone/menaquinone biosynthesis C-methylase UbiE
VALERGNAVREKLDANLQKELDVEYHRVAAAKYDAAVTQYYQFYHVHWLHPWIRGLVTRIPEPMVLDLGTGTGVVACTLAKFGCRVHAVDHSPEMLAIARERARTVGVEPQIKFDLGDAERLPCTDESFDAVAIQGVLHHLPDTGPLLREAIRVLRPGGELYISEPCIEGTAISRFVNGVASRIRRWLRLRGDDPNVSEHEMPIEGGKLVRDLKAMGLATKAEYLVNVGLVRFFPEALRIYIVLALSLPTRRKKGDLILLVGKKPSR